MSVIANGYDLSVFRPDNVARERVRTELGISAEQPVIGFVARFDPQKDHKNLLSALALLKTQGVAPVCLLVGTGMEQANAQLSMQIAHFDLSASIRLLGRRNDIPAVMNALDLHVMSSAFGEAFPNVLSEAMACETPCVTTDVGDAAVIVGETGWIVPPRDSGALADALTRALSISSAERRARGQAARVRVQTHYSLGLMVERYQALYTQLAEGR
jgi:glycosyltransferase involved in cell wall biosynthesis